MGRRGDHTKAELAAMALDAATALLEEEGPDKLTTRAVAGRIGYTVGSLYFLFRNRDDLVFQVNERTLRELATALEPDPARCSDPLTSLLTMGQGYIAFAEAHPARWRLVFEHRPASGDPIPDRLLRSIDGLFGLVAGQLTRLSPAMGADDLRRTSQTLWSGVHGIAVLSVTGKLGVGGEIAPQALVEDLLRHYLLGLRMELGGV